MPAALVVVASLALGSTGCIAYRAATPAWLNAESAADPRLRARRDQAVRRRGVIATSVGVGELLVAAFVVAVLVTYESQSESDTVAGGFADTGKELLGLLALGGAGAFAAMDGISNVTCGAIDLLSSSTCDSQLDALRSEDDEDGPAAPARAGAAALASTPAAAEPSSAAAPAREGAVASARATEAAELSPAAAPARATEADEPSPATAPARATEADEPSPTVAPALDAAQLAGDFERREPDGTRVLRIAADGRFRIAADRAQLELSRFEGLGTWRLDGDQLTLTRVKGPCAGSAATQTGVYQLAAATVGIRLTRVVDACAARAALDGSTWWRIR